MVLAAAVCFLTVLTGLVLLATLAANRPWSMLTFILVVSALCAGLTTYVVA